MKRLIALALASLLATPAFAQNWQGLSGGVIAPQNIDQGFNTSGGGGGGASGIPGPANTVWTTNSSGTAVGWVLPGSGGTVTNVSWNASLLGGLLSGSVATASTTPVLQIASASGLTSHQVLGTFAGTTITLGSLTAADLPSTAVNTAGNLTDLFTTSISAQALSFAKIAMGAHQVYGNGTGASANPVPFSLGTGDLPSSVVTATGNAAPLFTASITAQTLGYVLSTFAAHTFYGNPSGTTATPSAATIGAADLPATTVNATGNAAPLFTSSISSQALGFVLSTFAPHTFYGNPSGTTATPSAATIGVGDLPAAVVASVGNCATLFTSSVSGQALSFTQSAFGAHTVYGNGTGSTATPGPFTLGTGDLPVSTVFGPQTAPATQFCNGVNSSGAMTFATPTGGGGGSNFNGAPGGRLTLTTGVPVTTSDVTGATTLFYTPYIHDTSYTYVSSLWAPYTFTQYTASVPASQFFRIYDVFDNGTGLTLTAWDSGGQTTAAATAATTANPCVVSTTGTFSVGQYVGLAGFNNTVGTNAAKGINGKVCRISAISAGVSITLEGMDTSSLVASTTGTIYGIPTSRTGAVSILQGHYADSSNRLFLGTFMTDGIGGQTDDSHNQRLVSNYNNRVQAPVTCADTTTSWTTTTSTPRCANANSTSGVGRVEVVKCVQESTDHFINTGIGSNSVGQVGSPGASIGVNSNVVDSSTNAAFYTPTTLGPTSVAILSTQLAAGYSFIQREEYTLAANTLTSRGTGFSVPIGLSGEIWR